MERDQGLQVSMLCDRTCINQAKAQIGFIDVIIEPGFELLEKILPKVRKSMEQARKNKAKWECVSSEYEPNYG